MLYACMEKDNLKTDVLSIPIEECVSEGMRKEDVFHCITYSENEDKIEDNPIVLKFKILS